MPGGGGRCVRGWGQWAGGLRCAVKNANVRERPDGCAGVGPGLEDLVYRLNCKALSYTWREAIEDFW